MPSRPRLTILTAPSAAVRLDAAGACLRRGLAGGGEALLVGETREAADDLAHEIAVDAGATFGLHRYSLRQLAIRVATAELVRGGLTPASLLTTEAVAARAAFEELGRGALDYLHPIARFRSFGRTLAATLRDLRHADVDAAAADGCGGSGPDVARLARRYAALLEEARLADGAAVLRAAARVAREGGGGRGGAPLDGALVLLDVAVNDDATLDFVSALAGRAADVLATVPAGDDRTRGALETLPGAVASTAGGPSSSTDAPAEAAPAADPLDRVRAYLFAVDDPPPAAGAVGTDAPPAVSFFSAPGEGREAVEIVRAVLADAARGVPFDRMAVMLRSPTVYAGPLETAFDRAGIGTWFAKGARVPHPAGRAFLALLACAAERLSARRFSEYLSLGQVPRLDPTGAPPTDRGRWIPPDSAPDLAAGPSQPSMLDLIPDSPAASDPPPASAAAPPASSDPAAASAAAAVTSAAPLASGAASAAPNQAAASESVSTPDPVATPAAPAPDQAAARAAADPAASAAAPPVDSDDEPVLAGSLRAPYRWDRLLVESAVVGGRDRWARRLDGLARELALRRETLRGEDPASPRLAGLARDLGQLAHLRRFALPVIDRLAALPDEASWGEWLTQLKTLAPMVLATPDRVLAVLGDLDPMARVGPVRLADVRDVLDERLTELPADPPARRAGRVFVGGAADLRGRRFRVVFVPGLVERVFPRPPRQDPLLLDRQRKEFGKGDPDRASLRLRSDLIVEEKLRLRLAIGAATERIFLSYPRLESSRGRPRVPSFYALEVERARTGRVPDFQQVERRASAVAAARLAWPAPSDPARAIDDAEHDLAVLRDLRAAPAGTATGRARYLFRLNAGLRRALVARWQRNRQTWSRHDGLYGGGAETTAALAADRLDVRAYSVSALQQFAVCPYKFLLSAIHRLRPRETVDPPIERMEPLTRGRLIHEVQAATVRTLAARDRLPVTRARIEEAGAVMDDLLDRIAATYAEQLAPAIPGVWTDQVEAVRRDLDGWLRRVADEDGAWIPMHAEFGFGVPQGADRAPASTAEPVTLADRWRLVGVVDLIEARGGPSARGELRVTDHKTGRNRTRDGMVIGGGETLQPVLYGLAVEQALGRPVDGARLFFCTAAGGFEQRVVPLDDAAKRRGIEVLEIVDRAVETGVLLPAPRMDACRWCEFLEVCGPWQARRAARKDPAPLADLAALRSTP